MYIYFIISYLYCIVITAALLVWWSSMLFRWRANTVYTLKDRYEKQFSFFCCECYFVCVCYGELLGWKCRYEWSKNMNNVSFLLPLFCINGDFMCFSCMMLLHIYHSYMLFYVVVIFVGKNIFICIFTNGALLGFYGGE